jgi:hypothetical protein
VLFTPVSPLPGEKLSDSAYFNLTGFSTTAYLLGASQHAQQLTAIKFSATRANKSTRLAQRERGR